jgi:hypothetical protein
LYPWWFSLADDSTLTHLLTMAPRSLQFGDAFLKDPEGVAARVQVNLTGDQLEKTMPVAVLIEEPGKIRMPSVPVVCPIDDTVIRWNMHDVAEYPAIHQPSRFFQPR